MNQPSATAAADPRAARCAPDLKRYAALLAELALLFAAVKLYRLDGVVGSSFLRACGLAFGGFALFYWVPLRFKEWFSIALSLGGAFWILEPATAALVIGAGLLFFAISSLPGPHALRVGLILAVAIACTAGRAYGVAGLPTQLWAVLGSIFLFRLIVWTYDLRHMKGRPSLKEFLAYFFLLPNWGCLLFPVVDFHTQRRSFLARDHHDVAQRGVQWMARGVVQLLLYDLVYYRKPIADPATVDSFGALLLVMVTTYLLYLRLSGTFHFVIGMLHLFGYDLPETHRKYLLASSLTDFWRRINIYWKDFMVKVVYFPVWFRLRRRGEAVAQVVATSLVFVVTWFLHGWQTFWITGRFPISGPDAAFWGVLGLLVIVNLLVEIRANKPAAPGRSATAAADRPAPLVRVLKISGTFLVLTTLWSMWNAKTFAQWADLLTWWRVGD